MANALNWFEIPVTDMDRAKAFYGKVLDAELQTAPNPEDTKGMDMTFLPAEGGVGGALVQSKEWGYVPSKTGSVVYLNGGKDLSTSLSRVESAGGKVLLEKMSIGENGFIAFFEDTEGNKVGLHSQH